MNAGSFDLRGELAYRVGKNMIRLEDEYFTPEAAYGDETMNGGWPADREGRAMLADTLLSRLTGRESAHLERFYRQMPLNELGYRGPMLSPRADEQQLSGHNWLLRALLEMYEWKKDDRSRALARRLVENLYLPLRGKYGKYPMDPGMRVVGGGFSGETDGMSHEIWITSTDVGCAFMCLDGLSQYYDLFRDQRVLELLEEMIQVFASIDLVALKMQTHATLSATRGILRLYRATGRAELLSLATRVFDTYRREGMSDSYANYNWFDRPEWTEPCAMVDSLIVALQLFDFTGSEEYMDFAHRAFYTGLGYAQRPNGGFGCDSCVGAGEDGDVLSVRTPEAFWCCSMRGAEGLFRMAEHLLVEREGALTFCAYSDGQYRWQGARIEICSRWPYEGQVEMELTGFRKGQRIRLWAPRKHRISINGVEIAAAWENGFASLALPQTEEGAMTIALEFDMPLEYRGAVGKFTPRGRVSLWRGPLMLGGKPGAGAPDIAKMIARGKRAETPAGEAFVPINQVIFQESAQPVGVMFAK